MQTYASRVEFEDASHGQAVVHVQSKICWYKVVMRMHRNDSSEVIITGPGVEYNLLEEIEDADEAIMVETILDLLPVEQRAIMAVILFEESN